MADPNEYNVGVLTEKDEADMATYPADVQDIIRTMDEQAREEFRHYTEDFTYEVVDGIVHQYDKNGHKISGWHGAITPYFSLSYASWLAIPRLTLQEMPMSWQARFVALLEEAQRTGAFHIPECKITVIGPDGKYVDGSHWHQYRHGSVADALATDAALKNRHEAAKAEKRARRLADIEHAN